jgi:hypothetical protein
LTSNLPEGEYKLRVVTKYNGEVAISYETFTIKYNETQENRTLPEPERPERPEPITQNLTEEEIIIEDEALKQCQSNPQEATEQCTSLLNPNNQDICLLQCAEIVKNPDFCVPMTNQQTKDNCYVSVNLETGINDCEEIQDPITKKTCESFKTIQRFSKDN